MRRHTFRYLVAGVVLSFIYDIIWLYMLYAEYEGDQTGEILNEGSLEKLELQMKQFSVTIVIVSLIFRIIVILVYWRASIDYRAVVKQEQLR